MPAKGSRKSDPLRHRKKVPFTDAEIITLKQRARACGMTEAKFMRAAVLNSLGPENPKPKRKRQHQAQMRLAEIHQLAVHAKKIGTNVNQLAKQANQGMVAITRAEVQLMLNQLHRFNTLAITCIERELA